MRRRNRFSIEPKYIFVFLLVLCSVLLFASYKYKEKFSPIRGVVGDIITPMQKGINSVGAFFTVKTDIFTSKQENKELSALKIAQYRLCERIVSEFFGISKK